MIPQPAGRSSLVLVVGALVGVGLYCLRCQAPEHGHQWHLWAGGLLYAVSHKKHRLVAPIQVGLTVFMPPLIDTHLHLWDPGAFDMPWLDGSSPVLERVFTMKDYADATVRFPPTKSIYIEVDVVPSDRLAEFNGVIELLLEESNPLCAAIMAADPAGPDLVDWITRAQEVQGVPGFRMVLHQDASFLLLFMTTKS